MSYLDAFILTFSLFFIFPVWIFIVVKTIAKAWHGGILEVYTKSGKGTNQPTKGEANGKTRKK